PPTRLACAPTHTSLQSARYSPCGRASAGYVGPLAVKALCATQLLALGPTPPGASYPPQALDHAQGDRERVQSPPRTTGPCGRPTSTTAPARPHLPRMSAPLRASRLTGRAARL